MNTPQWGETDRTGDDSCLDPLLEHNFVFDFPVDSKGEAKEPGDQ